MSSGADDFTNNANDSPINIDDSIIYIEPHDIDERCGELECQEYDCDSENSFPDNNFQPYVGMDFASDKEAYNFYNIYGYANGFSIRRGSSYKNTEEKVTSVRFTCSKQGLNLTKKTHWEGSIENDVEPHEKTPEREVSIKRCGCKASIQIRLHEDGIWRVTAFNKDHNHELVKNTPSKKRNLRSHKFISEDQKQEIRLLSEQNVGTAQMREYLAAKKGGREHLHFSKKDLSNKVARENRNLVGVDVATMIEYFLEKQQVDPDFFFAIEPDDDNVAKNIFWIDGRSRRAYQVFGDVVTFDTTYSTNKYSMPLAPFIGVNHHWHNIYFGCALIRDEKKTTFSWLFETWLQAVGEKPPKAIITDQDPAMRAAIKEVFPNTIHRCCQWHIMRKARDHLGTLYGSIPGFKDELRAIIDYSWTVSEFEKNWKHMVKFYKLKDNPHLNLLFDNRDEWVPAYFRSTFMADMSTSQRSESMNATLKIWMTCNTSLYRFAVQFDKLLGGTYERESDEDIRTMNETPVMCSCDPIEAEARKVYTRAVFSLFKERVRKSTAFRVRELEKDMRYEVRPAVPQIKYAWYNPTCTVYIDRENARVECDCKGFEFQGLLCAHSIAVMRQVQIEPFLPMHYVLKRWMRNANSKVKRPLGEVKATDDLKSVMLAALTEDMQKVATKAVKNHATYDLACARIRELDVEVTDINNSKSIDFTELNQNAAATTKPSCAARKSLQYHDPPVSQCKGKRKPHRFKPPSELKDVKKMRTCGFCNRKEGHNMKTCPKRIAAEKERRDLVNDFQDDDSEEHSME